MEKKITILKDGYYMISPADDRLKCERCPHWDKRTHHCLHKAMHNIQTLAWDWCNIRENEIRKEDGKP